MRSEVWWLKCGSVFQEIEGFKSGISEVEVGDLRFGVWALMVKALFSLGLQDRKFDGCQLHL